MFPSLKENLGDHNFKSHCEAETVVKRWLTTQKNGLISIWNRNAPPIIR